jgi:putative endonuclease
VSPETTTVLGRRAEDSALDYLRAHGLELLTRNYRCRGGEIDLVMREQDVLVLVEVRSRASSGYGSAAATVDGRKQSRIVHAARHLLRTRPELARLKARFDVVALEPAADGSSGVEMRWIRDAFRTSG